MVPAKLLLADDSVTIQRVIELTFADENVQVVAVGDGKEAIERVKADRPDIVLADIGMPERDGYQVAEFIKGNPELSHIPVLLLTGAFEPIDEARARSAGCEGVLVKPFEPQMVISRVRELLNKAAAAEPPASSAVPPAPPAAQASPAPAAAPRSAAAPEETPAPVDSPSQPAASGPESLEAYFDRLDAALSTRSTPPPAGETTAVLEPPAAEPQVEPQVAHESAVVTGPAAEASARPAVPVASAPASTVAMPSLYDAFTALLAAEKGQGPPLTAADPAPAYISDELIEQIVGRVLARMADDSMRQAVLDTAERLVRQEIERIKNIPD